MLSDRLLHLCKTILVFVIIWVAAAATHQGFYSKWNLRDSANRFGIHKIIDGTAHKPFVYRQLVPEIARKFEQFTPEKVQTQIETFVRSNSVLYSSWGQYEFTYWIVYYLHFMSVFLSILGLRALLLSEGVSAVIATLTPCIFLLFTPYLQTFGGYFYDNFELLFFASAVLLAKRQKIFWLVPLTVAATYNKESFLLFIPCLYPFIRQQLSLKASIGFLAALMLIAAAINLHLKTVYAGNSGGNVEIWLSRNLHEYFSISTYFKFEETYGIVSPKGVNVLTLLALFSVVRLGWGEMSQVFRTHTLIAAAISFPLFILFCYTGELRNLSFLYVSLTMLLALAIGRLGSAKPAA